MKVLELIQTRTTPFKEGYLGVLGGTGSRGDILSSTFVKLKD